MHELGAAAACALAEVVRLKEHHTETAGRRVNRYAHACSSATDDGNVHGVWFSARRRTLRTISSLRMVLCLTCSVIVVHPLHPPEGRQTGSYWIVLTEGAPMVQRATRRHDSHCSSS